MENIYPLLEEKDFTKKLLSNPEFKYYKYDDPSYIHDRNEIKKLANNICNNISGYIYKQIQLFISNYISLNTPYNGILLYHGVGVGKTCSSLLIADNFKDYVKKHKKKIIILTKPAIQNTFKNEIFNHNDYIDNIDKHMFKCLSSEILDDWHNFEKKNDSSKYNSFTDTHINDYFEIYGYQQFVNVFKKQTLNEDKSYNTNTINSMFSDIVLIIDEVHNLRDTTNDIENITKSKKKDIETIKEIKKFIHDIITHLNNPIKLILLSATPMYDQFEEIQYIINLLLLNDKKNILSPNIFKKYLEAPTQATKLTLSNEIYEKTQGYISYIKGNNPLIFPQILYPQDSLNLYFKEYTNYFPIILSEMKSPQKEIYYELCRKSNHMESQKYINVTFPIKLKLDIFEENIHTFYDLFKEVKTKHKSKHYSIIDSKKPYAQDFLDNLDKYSCKLYNLLQNINNPPSKGKLFIYSAYVDPKMGGGLLISMLLEYIGFQRKIINKDKLEIDNCFINNTLSRQNKFYIQLDGNTSDNDRNLYIQYFNSMNNIHGDNIQIIIGSTNLFEGVSLFNLREVHIMEPWYNKSRYDQIIGRGIRQCSHKNLPFEHRNITIYNYIAIPDPNILQKIDTNNYISNIKKDNLNGDLHALRISIEKESYIKSIESLLQYNAIDCFLNKSINSINYNYITHKINFESDLSIIKMTNSKNQDTLIQFTSNDISCRNFEDDILPTSNNIHRENIFVNSKLIQNIKYYIKTIYNTISTTYLSFNKIKELINSTHPNENINDNLIKLALQSLILNKEIIYNQFNIKGFLIIKGNYFIFNSFDNMSLNIPYEFINFPFKYKINNITDFHNYTISPNFNISTKKTYYTQPVDTPSTADSIDLSKTTTSQIKDFNTLHNTFSNISLNDHTNNLLQECYLKDFFSSLHNNNIINTFRYLWASFNPHKGKNNPDLNTIINNIQLFNYNELHTEVTNSFISSIGRELFNIDNLDTNITKIPIYNEKHFVSFVYDLYNVNYHIFFLYNFHFIILNSLKCVFYKKYIKKHTLNEYENELIKNYKYLIIKETPLTFKFIDYSKNKINKYDYKNIVYNIFIFDPSTNTWNIELNTPKININISKDLFMEELKITENQFNQIYNSFDYNNENKYNNGYFKYCGSPLDSKKNYIEPINILTNINTTKHIKFTNIIGHVSVKQTDTNLNLSPLSRIIFDLGIIYSLPKENSNIYFKGTHNSSFSILKPLSVNQQILHIIYCIIDQITELNKLIIYETILNKSDLYNTIWNQHIPSHKKPLKYIIDPFIEFDFKTNTFIFTKDNYTQLQSFLYENLDISINKYDTLLANLELIKDQLYNYNNILILLQQLYNYDDNKKNKKPRVFVGGAIDKKIATFYNNSFDKNKYNKELYITKLFIMILYDLNSKQFYNKRWLLNLFESTLLNFSLLNLSRKSPNTYSSGRKTRSADSASITKNTFIQMKGLEKRALKFVDFDNA